MNVSHVLHTSTVDVTISASHARLNFIGSDRVPLHDMLTTVMPTCISWYARWRSTCAASTACCDRFVESMSDWLTPE